MTPFETAIEHLKKAIDFTIEDDEALDEEVRETVSDYVNQNLTPAEQRHICGVLSTKHSRAIDIGVLAKWSDNEDDLESCLDNFTSSLTIELLKQHLWHSLKGQRG